MAASAPDGWFHVYKPGSIVSVLFNGNFVQREIIEPKLADPFNTGVKTLFYTYRLKSGTDFVPHNQVQPTGQDWPWVVWSPETNEFQDLDQPDVYDRPN